jgi:amidophosphoribosyltransferase
MRPGIFGHPEAAAITHSGSTLSSIAARSRRHRHLRQWPFSSERRLGLVGDTFSRAEVISRLPGNMAVGHVRYSTTGGTILRNVQPLFAELNAGGFAVAHNGNLTNGLTPAGNWCAMAP